MTYSIGKWSKYGFVAVTVGIVLALLDADAHANDSAAGLDGGQVVLKSVDGIRMESEDLFISRKQVRVRYQFRNVTEHDIQTVVAFPLPPMPAVDDGDVEDNWIGEYDYKSTNPLKFALRVDGHPTEVQTERKPVPAKPTDYRLNQLTHYWTQRFPAGKTVVVEHSYVPAASFRLITNRQEDNLLMLRDFCVGTQSHKSIFSLAPYLGMDREVSAEQVISVSWINYILKTARNWTGPIGRFHLTIEKKNTREFISVCLEGLKKVSPTRFEFAATNYVPAHDLSILFSQPFTKQ